MGKRQQLILIIVVCFVAGIFLGWYAKKMQVRITQQRLRDEASKTLIEAERNYRERDSTLPKIPLEEYRKALKPAGVE